MATGARNVGVGQLVDQGYLGPAGDDGIDVHLLPVRIAVADPLSRHDRKVPDLPHGIGALVRLDEPDDNVGTALEASPPFVQHGAGLAHPRRRAEINPELAGRSNALFLTSAQVHSHLASLGPITASVHSKDAPKDG